MRETRFGSIRTGGWLNEVQDEQMGVTLSPDDRRLYLTVSAGMETFSAS